MAAVARLGWVKLRQQRRVDKRHLNEAGLLNSGGVKNMSLPYDITRLRDHLNLLLWGLIEDVYVILTTSNL